MSDTEAGVAGVVDDAGCTVGSKNGPYSRTRTGVSGHRCTLTVTGINDWPLTGPPHPATTTMATAAAAATATATGSTKRPA